MIIGITIILCSLIYIILLTVIYLSKKRMDNIENKIYNKLIILDIICLALEFFCCITVSKIVDIDILKLVVNKAFLVAVLTWVFLFSKYMVVISFNNENKVSQNVQKNNNWLSAIFNGFYIISSLIIVVLPLNYYYDGFYVYSYGPSAYFLFAATAMFIITSIVCIFLNIKNIPRKKIIPMFVFLTFIIMCWIVRILNPGILLINATTTFVTVLMFFTIENPDLFMIEQLNIARDQADKANRAKTDFLSSMSHEIRTPLNAIVGFSNEIVDAKDLEEAKSNAKDIVNASDTLLEIVNGILDISKIEAGKFEIVCSPYNAPETFKELAKLITPRMEEHGLDFTYKIADDLPQTLYGDHANIKKVVTNFLSNAAKYTEHGFVRYEVNCIKNGDNCRLIITVEDSGRGIKKEKVDKLFTKFDRLDVDRNTTVEGTGLGLAITKQLVEMMGGKIVVHTVFGEGSKFTAMIDQKIDETPVEVIEVNSTIDLSKTKILLVDDNKLNLKVESKVLNRFNCTDIDLANDGYECIEKVKDNKYDIILLDDMMPKMSGSETLKKLKEIDGFNTPVVALTANAITGMRESYIAQGFDEYLAKPLEREELVKVLNKLLFNTGAPTSTSFESNDENKEEKVEEKVEEKEEPKVEEKSVEIDTSEEHLDNTVEIITDEFIRDDNIEKDNGEDKSEVLEEKEPINIEEPPAIDPVEYLKSNGVDMDKALELLGDMEMYNMTITDFSNELEDKWSRIEEEKLNGDMENYAVDVHSLKSDCKYLGFYDLADVAYEHELKSKEKNIDFVNENFERLEIEYEKVLHIVKNYMEKINKGN